MYPMGADQPSIIVPPTEPMPDCPADLVEEAPCTTMGDRCQILTPNDQAGDTGDMCACWLTDDDGQTIWDCDGPPSFW